MVQRKNVRRDKTSGDQTSGGTQYPAGQNVKVATKRPFTNISIRIKHVLYITWGYITITINITIIISVITFTIIIIIIIE
jgi:hypothetical protein